MYLQCDINEKGEKVYTELCVCQDPMFGLVIKDFKSVQDRRIETPEFKSGGCRWCVMVYPKGDEGHNSMDVYMVVGGYEYMPPGWKIKAKFWLSIEIGSERIALQGAERCFDAECPMWGMSNWLHRSKLSDGFLDLNGDLKIEAHVEVLHKSDPMFTWVIKDFKSVQDRSIESPGSEIIPSPEFESGGCRWCITVFPKGDKVHNSMAMYMAVRGNKDMPPGWKINAKLWLSIESPYERRAMDGGERCFDSKSLAWGLSNWLHRSELDDGFLDLNGDLKIEAHVEVLHKSGV